MSDDTPKAERVAFEDLTAETLEERACRGLSLPADVPAGAVKRLVEAAMSAWRENEAMSRLLKNVAHMEAGICGREANHLKAALLALGQFGDTEASRARNRALGGVTDVVAS